MDEFNFQISSLKNKKYIFVKKEIRFKAYESIKEFCSDKVIFNKEIFYEEKIKFDFK